MMYFGKALILLNPKEQGHSEPAFPCCCGCEKFPGTVVQGWWKGRAWRGRRRILASSVPLQPMPSVGAATQASTSPVSLSLHPPQPQQGWGLEVLEKKKKKNASTLLFFDCSRHLACSVQEGLLSVSTLTQPDFSCLAFVFKATEHAGKS